MESAYELVPYTSSVPSSRPSFRVSDPEIGFHRCLSVQQVTSSLSDRLVTEISTAKGAWKPLLLFGIFGIPVSMLTGLMFAVLSMLIALAACPEDSDGETELICFPGSSLIAGGAFCLLSHLICMCCGITDSIRLNFERFKALKDNAKLNQEIACLSYRASTDEPLEASDFVRLFRKGWIDPQMIKELSFDQLRMIKLIDQNIFESLNSDMSQSQKGPWRKLDLIARSVLGDITDALSEDYIRTKFEDTPGFFEELMQTLPRDILEHPDAKAALIDSARRYISSRLETSLSDEQILEGLREVLDGGMLENCLSLLAGVKLLQLKCQGRNVSVDADILKQKSSFFEGFFRMHPTESEYLFDDLTPQQFDIFINFLRGYKIAIDEDNVFDFLEVANYFDMKSLAEACISPLMKKLKGSSLEKRLFIVEKYPILTGRFKQQVDEDYAESLKLSIQKDREGFKEAHSQARRLRLNHSLSIIDKLREDNIREWRKNLSPEDSLESFLKTFNLYCSVLHESTGAEELLQKVVWDKMNENDEALAFFYNKALEMEDRFLAESVLNYMHDPSNRENVEGTFIAVNHALEQLQGFLS